MSHFSVAVDIGGTFTDFVVHDGARQLLHTAKVLSTPKEPDRAIFQGLEELARTSGLDLRNTTLFLHATTLITNAVIERRGSNFILLHTEGFRDVLEIGREHRYNLTNLRLRFPEPLSDRALRVAIEERTTATGHILKEPNKERVVEQLRSLSESHKICSFAICFLHSYRNPRNESLVGEWIRQIWPNAYISASSSVAPGEREYERWTTCSVNAYTMPLLAGYIGRLEQRLADQGFCGKAMIMTSAGVPIAFESCIRYPVRMIESGPAAGVLAAKVIANRNATADTQDADEASRRNVLAFDMGGTTAKGAFLPRGEYSIERSLEVARIGAFERGSGFPLMVPAIDLIEIGAGGGSIATVDDRGVIAVGPRSAGADPGPACYNLGGDAPTVTDANLVLGFLDERNFRNSGIEVHKTLSYEAIRNKIARKLEISVERAAFGIHETVNENVARAFRVHAAELGIDYRRYTLVCTGGSAPVHAAAIARKLGIRRVIFPFAAGVSSAFGLFAGQEGITLQRTKIIPLASVTKHLLTSETDRIVQSDAYAERLKASGARTNLTLGMRYVGQGYEVTVRLRSWEQQLGAPQDIKTLFEQEYQKIFGIHFEQFEIEIFSWTLELTTDHVVEAIKTSMYANVQGSEGRDKGNRRILMGPNSEEREIPIYNRYALRSGDVISGGALIEENDTTILLPPFAHGVVVPSLDIIATVEH